MLNKICTFGGCNAVVSVDPLCDKSPRCEKHQLSYTPKKRYDWHYYNNRHIYTSPQWRSLRARKVAMNPICEVCEELDLIRPVEEVDHIKEIRDGGEIFDVNNLQSLCRSCHSRKTARERKKREHNKNNKGFKSFSDF